MQESKHFRISGFDQRAAVEFAATQASRAIGGLKPVQGLRAKAKFDDQIISIAAVEGASIIYSDDGHILKAAGSKFKVIGIADLPLPQDEPQLNLQLSNTSEEGG